MSDAFGEESRPLPSSRRRRLLAFAFDHFLFTLVGAVAGFAMLGPHWDMNPRFDRTGVFPMLGVVMALYFCKDLIGGQSIGRAIFAIAVRDAEDPTQTPSAGRLIRRNLFLPIWPVELLALTTSATRQRIGDRLAGTCVVRVSSPLRPRLLAGVGFASALTLAFLTSATHLVRSSAAYEVATAHLRTDTGVGEVVGRVVGFGSMPSGRIQVQNDEGRAELAIVVEGADGMARTLVRLQKEAQGEWEVQEVTID
ncbi:MAG: cytochrome c oxidase assembly factor Coa1 family protein [Myxococcota bacterium]